MADDKPREHNGLGPYVIAVYNQKGGVAKTTTATNLALSLAAYGQTVILVDLDAQGNATSSLGIVPPPHKGIYDVLTGVHSVDAVQVSTRYPRLSVLPATEALSSIDLELALTEDPHGTLGTILHSKDVHADYVIIDCPPTFSMLPINALVAADSVLIPIHTDPLAHDGLTKAWGNIKRLQQKYRLNLGVHGLLLTMVDENEQSERDLAAIIRNEFGEKVYKSVIPRDPTVITAAAKDVPVALFAPDSPATKAYVAFTAEFLRRETVLLSRKAPGKKKKITQQERNPEPEHALANLKTWANQLKDTAPHDFIADSINAPPLADQWAVKERAPANGQMDKEIRKTWRFAASVLLILIGFIGGFVAGTSGYLRTILEQSW